MTVWSTALRDNDNIHIKPSTPETNTTSHPQHRLLRHHIPIKSVLSWSNQSHSTPRFPSLVYKGDVWLAQWVALLLLLQKVQGSIQGLAGWLDFANSCLFWCLLADLGIFVIWYAWAESIVDRSVACLSCFISIGIFLLRILLPTSLTSGVFARGVYIIVDCALRDYTI
jgi:hypothetical protein